MYTKKLQGLLLSILLPRVVISVAIDTISSRYGSDLIVRCGGILIKIATMPRVLRRRYLLLGLRITALLDTHHIGGLLALHTAGLLGSLLGLLGLLIGLLALLLALLLVLLIVLLALLLSLLIVLLVVLLLGLISLLSVLWLRLRLWLRLWLRLCVWLWLEQTRHCYTHSPAHSLDHTLIVGVHPPTVGPQLPHLGLPPLIPTPQTLYLGLQRCNASICGGASSTRAPRGAGVIVRPP